MQTVAIVLFARCSRLPIFAHRLESTAKACPGAFINIGNAGTVGSCPVHNPHYDFNDAALPIGASLFARLVEKKLPRLSIT
jgi:metal-dependent amidase/aminoacylase/carboxypeptidase family protein